MVKTSPRIEPSCSLALPSGRFQHSNNPLLVTPERRRFREPQFSEHSAIPNDNLAKANALKRMPVDRLVSILDELLHRWLVLVDVDVDECHICKGLTIELDQKPLH